MRRAATEPSWHSPRELARSVGHALGSAADGQRPTSLPSTPGIASGETDSVAHLRTAAKLLGPHYGFVGSDDIGSTAILPGATMSLRVGAFHASYGGAGRRRLVGLILDHQGRRSLGANGDPELYCVAYNRQTWQTFRGFDHASEVQRQLLIRARRQ